MSILRFLLLSPVLYSLTAVAHDEVCHQTDNGEIAQLFERWNNTLLSGDAKKVVANYAYDSVLLPTLSNLPRLTPDAKEDYFHQFLVKHPAAHIDERTIFIACNSATDIGLYTFTFNDGSQIAARYSFAYQWDGRQWLIAAHHSSPLPEQPSTTPSEKHWYKLVSLSKRNERH